MLLCPPAHRISSDNHSVCYVCLIIWSLFTCYTRIISFSSLYLPILAAVLCVAPVHVRWKAAHRGRWWQAVMLATNDRYRVNVTDCLRSCPVLANYDIARYFYFFQDEVKKSKGFSYLAVRIRDKWRLSCVSCYRRVGDRKTKLSVLVCVWYCRGVRYSNGNNGVLCCVLGYRNLGQWNSN